MQLNAWFQHVRSRVDGWRGVPVPRAVLARAWLWVVMGIAVGAWLWILWTESISRR